MAESNGAGSSGKDWRELCAKAVQEFDSEKLGCLVDQILTALDEDDPRSRSAARPTVAA